jgi:hypothetical protein
VIRPDCRASIVHSRGISSIIPAVGISLPRWPR